MNDSTVVVAGATGNLGGRIARALLKQGASVKALVRHSTPQDKIARLQELGVKIASWTQTAILNRVTAFRRNAISLTVGAPSH